MTSKSQARRLQHQMPSPSELARLEEEHMKREQERIQAQWECDDMLKFISTEALKAELQKRSRLLPSDPPPPWNSWSLGPTSNQS